MDMAEDIVPESAPIVASVEMGYGHVRAALAIADALGSEMVRVDRAPIVGPVEERLWSRVRFVYEATSRISQIPLLGAPIQGILDEITRIPHLHPMRDQSAPTSGALLLDWLVGSGLGKGLVRLLQRTERPIVTTFYTPAIVADRVSRAPVYCVVTDTDVNRVWAPRDARGTVIRYLVPSTRAARRLQAYGVPPSRITFTGFPLPHDLVGGPELPVLRRNLAERLVRLDPSMTFRREHGEDIAHFLRGTVPAGGTGESPLLAFAVGGAGAQAELARRFLPSMRELVEAERIRLALVAGTRPQVREMFEEAVQDSGLQEALGNSIEILFEPDVERYVRSMNRLLARTDVLWTKPSELCFYAALGIPLICAAPVGMHERVNRRWVREQGAGFKQRDPRFAGDWITDLLEDGSLASAAWSGYMRLPKFGLYRILRAMGAPMPAALGALDRASLAGAGG
jgi:hypothetical protein